MKIKGLDSQLIGVGSPGPSHGSTEEVNMGPKSRKHPGAPRKGKATGMGKTISGKMRFQGKKCNRVPPGPPAKCQRRTRGRIKKNFLN